MTLYPGQLKWAGVWRTSETLFNFFLIALGFYILVAGTYVRPLFFYSPLESRLTFSLIPQTSVQSIIDSYAKNLYGTAFSCATNAI